MWKRWDIISKIWDDEDVIERNGIHIYIYTVIYIMFNS